MRGANFFQKPEAALQRAQEFISVGKEQDALEALHDVIKDRRHKQWSQTHELILMKHLELCVNLRNSSLAKDALYQYKALTQQVAVKSLEDVMVHFLDLAERKTEDAQKASIEKIEEIDDLDVGDAPENLLLSVVSGAVAQDRMDRTVLSPWLRFLWDSYRNCLDLLRNNSLVEQLYHKIARQSFEFCAKYQRRNEFRKLCELLRMHLSQIQKNQGMSHAVKLTQAESLATMQDTRLVQLDTAIKMELWQEAYKSSEDLHNMMTLSKEKDKRMVKPTSYANYYDKLALVFWKGGNTLFHAAALLQKFTIYKDMKKSFNEDEATEQATRVLLATLSIPDGADSPSILTKHLDIEELHMQNIRVLSTLLRLPIAPTRAGIMKEITRLNIPEMATNTSRNLYNFIELDFSPLKIATSVQNELNEIRSLNRADYIQYIDRIKSVVATKVIKQVTMLYDSLSIARLRRIIPESFYNRIELERFLVEISKYGFVKAQIDHRNRSVCFGPVDATLAGDVETEFESDEPQNGLEMVRTHLETLYTQLIDAVYVLDGSKYQNEALVKLSTHIDIWHKTKDKDYENILNRRKKIEQYKEQSESLRQELTRQNQLEAYKKEEQRRAEEMRRLELEGKEAEKKRRVAEQEEIKKKLKMEQIKRFQQNPMYKSIVKEKGGEIFETMDPEQVIREQRQRLDKERKEQQAKQMQQEKKIDHWIRAVYLEEIKEYKKISEERRSKAPLIHQEYEARRVDKANQEHQKSLLTFERITKAREDATEFLQNVISSHRGEFEQSMLEWQRQLEAARAERLYEQRVQRAKDRKKYYDQQKIAEERDKQQKEMEQKAMQQQKEVQQRQSQHPPDRQMPFNREERRDERKPPPPESKADDDSNWRGNTKPVQPTTAPPQRVIQHKSVQPTTAPPQRVIQHKSVQPTTAPPQRVIQHKSKADSGNWRS